MLVRDENNVTPLQPQFTEVRFAIFLTHLTGAIEMLWTSELCMTPCIIIIIIIIVLYIM